MQPSVTSQYLARYQRLDTGGDLLPVTGAQRRFVLVRLLDPAGRPDVVPLFFAFPRGTVDLPRLRDAARSLAALHPALRARSLVVRGTPVQRLGEADVPVERIGCAPGENGAAALRRTLRSWTADGAPLRLYLADDGADATEEVLAVALDHAACDGQSLSRITGELSAAYRDRLGPQDVAPGSVAQELRAYREAVSMQLTAEERASGASALAYWSERLRHVRDAPKAGAQAASGPSAVAGMTGQAAGATAELPTGAVEAHLPVPAGIAAAVPFPELLDACRAAVRAWHGPGHVVAMGYPWGGRPAAAQPVLGCFLNTVVFPAATGTPSGGVVGDSPGGPAGDDTTTAHWWDDLDRADTPFDEVVHAARTAGAASWSGRLDGLLTVEDLSRRPPLRLGGVEGREVNVDGRAVRAPFAVSASHGDDLHLRMVWDRALHGDDAAQGAFDALTGFVRARLAARAAPAAVSGTEN
ncbi:condensation domain-containing protein [Streptomyces sp. H10-C2]|uniref:condensation domain-containing protein n=1 Tax=unclassified Streptomyces TaxID=2593676 RepID=UPI0024B9A830|nr:MULTISPECIES: condensation domain-containing protein [unclassified Streptomyces]MDJ0343480.1 condensation domain-containing protein [Streptomyces sp. PH10-H1]MDJ0371560.1 condensation domain-containing protein [Streptomyces sp. H10-C2]